MKLSLAVHGWKFTALYNCTRKEEWFKTNYLSPYFKKLEIEEQIKDEINEDFETSYIAGV